MSNQSRQGSDNFLGYEERPFGSLPLIREMIQQSDTLNQLMTVYSTNISGLGYGIKYKNDFDFNTASDEQKKKATAEWIVLENLYKYCNHKEVFSSLVKKVIYMRESYGFAFIEVLRNGLGQVSGFEICNHDNIFILKELWRDKSRENYCMSLINQDTLRYAGFVRFFILSKFLNTFLWD